MNNYAGNGDFRAPRRTIRAALIATRMSLMRKFHMLSHSQCERKVTPNREAVPRLSEDPDRIESPPRSDPPARIADFPVELLREIFLLCSRPPRTRPSGPIRAPFWSGVTQVCRQWRAIAIGYADLWTSITANLSAQWVRVLLERSYPLPVSMDLRVEHHVKKAGALRIHPEHAISLLADPSRLQELRLSGSRKNVARVLHSLGPVAALESITIHLTPASQNPHRVIPESVFGKDAPRLRRLEASCGTALGTPLWMLSAIQSFSTTIYQEPDIILDVLRQIPCLETLKIESYVAVTIWQDQKSRSHNPVSLNNLSLLVIEESVGLLGFSAFVVKYVRMPRTVRVRLRVSTADLPTTTAAWGPWMEHLSAVKRMLSWGTSSKTSFDQVHICGGPRKGDMYAWTVPLRTAKDATAMQPNIPPGDARIVFRFNWFLRFFEPRGFMSPAFLRLPDLLGHLPCTKVRTLTIAEDPYHDPIPPNCWEKLLAQVPSVEDLSLVGDATVILPSRDSRGALPPILPNLKRLRIIGIEVHGGKATKSLITRAFGKLQGAERKSGVPDKNSLLIGFLKARASGNPILQVTFIDCDIDPDTVKVLRGLFDDLRVGGRFLEPPSAPTSFTKAELSTPIAGDPYTAWTIVS